MTRIHATHPHQVFPTTKVCRRPVTKARSCSHEQEGRGRLFGKLLPAAHANTLKDVNWRKVFADWEEKHAVDRLLEEYWKVKQDADDALPAEEFTDADL